MQVGSGLAQVPGVGGHLKEGLDAATKDPQEKEEEPVDRGFMGTGLSLAKERSSSRDGGEDETSPLIEKPPTKIEDLNMKALHPSAVFNESR